MYNFYVKASFFVDILSVSIKNLLTDFIYKQTYKIHQASNNYFSHCTGHTQQHCAFSQHLSLQKLA